MARIIPEAAVTIPAHATQVFRGEIFDVFQWPQEMYDGSVATFEMLRRPDTVVFIAIRDDKLLFIVDEQPNRGPLLRLPGGRVDPGESWDMAVQRECLEELGLTFTQWRLVQVDQPVQKMEWFVAVYIASELASEQPQQLGPGERIVCRPLTFQQARTHVLADRTETYLRPLFEQCTSLDDLRAVPEYKGRELA